jgi:hypothetical protein
MFHGINEIIAFLYYLLSLEHVRLYIKTAVGLVNEESQYQHERKNKLKEMRNDVRNEEIMFINE